VKRPVRKEFIQNLGVLFASVFIVLLCAEGLLRVFRGKGLDIHNRFPQGVLCKKDPLLGWTGLPGASRVWSYSEEDMHDMQVVMNSEGFWDVPHKTHKAQGIRRLLFLGDSFTIGWAVPKEERFTDLIKEHLSSGYEVINMGMWGYSTDQELLVLEEKGLEYSPDIVIVSMFLDDLFCSNLFSVNDGMYVKPKFSLLADGALELCNFPVPNNHGRSALLNMILTRLYKLRNRLETGTEFDRLGWISVFDKAYFQKDGYYLSLSLLNQMYETSKANNSDFLLVIIPYKDQMWGSRFGAAGPGYDGIPPERLDPYLPQKVVILFCEKMGIPVLDLLPAFKRRSREEKLFFEYDLHWTTAGHRLAAEQVLAYLEQWDYL
jgi:hypothetical protein